MPLLLALLAASAALPHEAIEERERDWRYGPVVYQVFVDRFAPPKDLEAKRAIIRPPRNLRQWSEVPKPGKPVPSLGLYSHELEFWGGDLNSLNGKLDYIHDLGADVVYLNPIFLSVTNHKYDTVDYRQISPEYGTEQDFLSLVQGVHHRKMKVVLDGVFNHVGRSNPIFQSAVKQPDSAYRDWFYFDKAYPRGYRGWAGVGNLPALNLENPKVQAYLWGDPDSVVRHYLKLGIDGWRLDVAFEIGPSLLNDITQATHAAKPGSETIGEVWGYPSGWFPAVDGVYDFSEMLVADAALKGQISGGRAGLMLNHMALDAGIEHLLQSWLLLDNHDTARLATAVPELADRKLLHALQLTLPGAPVLYYGSELGMAGAGDPQNRAPMRWDLVTPDNPELAWVERLLRVRRSHPALRYGDFVALDSDRLLAFVRTTGKVLDTVLVAANPTDQPVQETFPTRVGRLLSGGEMEDQLTGEKIRTMNGLVTVKIPPKTVRIYSPVSDKSAGYSPYHRIP